MSFQNQKTVEAYQKQAKRYIASVNQIDETNQEKANEALYRFIKKSLKHMPNDGKVLEVGSANGKLSAYFKKLGYDITASDVADDFINEMIENGLEPIKFNLLEDKLNKKYHCIICWKVFVHFTEEDTLRAILRIYGLLQENGILILNFISDELKNAKEEWTDFPGEYSIGADRYFRYYSRKEVDDIIAKTKFQISSFHEETGLEGQKWLVYVLKRGA